MGRVGTGSACLVFLLLTAAVACVSSRDYKRMRASVRVVQEVCESPSPVVREDGWGNDLVIKSDPDRGTLVISLGKYGEIDHPIASYWDGSVCGMQAGLASDIVCLNGHLLQWPELGSQATPLIWLPVGCDLPPCGELYPLPVPDASGGVVLSNEVSYVLSPSGVGFDNVEIVSGESRLELESILGGGTGIRARNGSAGPFDLVLSCADGSRTEISGTIVDTSQEPEPSSISTTLVPGASARVKREGTVPIFLVERGGCVQLEVRVTREDGVVDEVTEHPGTVLQPLVSTLEQVTVTRPGAVCVDPSFRRPIFSIAVQHRGMLQTVIVEVVDHDSE